MFKNILQTMRAIQSAKIRKNLVVLLLLGAGMAFPGASTTQAAVLYQSSITWFSRPPYTDVRRDSPARATLQFRCDDFTSHNATMVQSYVCPNGNSVTNEAILSGDYGDVYVGRDGTSYTSFGSRTVADSIAGGSDCDGTVYDPMVSTYPTNCGVNGNDGGGGDGGGDFGGGGGGGGWTDDGGVTYCYQYCTQTASRYCEEENPYNPYQCDSWSDWDYGEPQCGYVECF